MGNFSRVVRVGRGIVHVDFTQFLGKDTPDLTHGKNQRKMKVSQYQTGEFL